MPTRCPQAIAAWVMALATGAGLLAAPVHPATAQFATAAPLATGRYYHTASRLPDGRVLVAGGNRAVGNSFAFVGTAEVYDPATNTWTSAGTLSPALAYHASTLLPNGKVLLTGGCEPATPAPPQVYDPATNAWSYAGSAVPLARLFPTATLLQDGRVLLVGGRYGPTGPVLGSAELFDPATGTWSAVPDMAAVRIRHTATLLASGRVLVAGGQDGHNNRYATAELYDPVTNSWSSGGTMTGTRDDHVATLLLDDTVLVAAGNGAIPLPFNNLVVTGKLSSAEIYDPVQNTWTRIAAEQCDLNPNGLDSVDIPGCLATARTGPTATLLPDGTVLVAGGITLQPDSSAEIYHPGTRTWTGAGDMSTPRELHAAVLLNGGKTLVVGGWNQWGGGTLASAETYTMVTGSPGFFLNVLVQGAGAGTVGSSPAGIACGVDCAEHFATGTNVTLLAAPAAGSVFGGWSGACTGTGACNLAMTAAKDVVANFVRTGAASAYAANYLQKSYVAYYGRPGDPPGLDYWATRMDQEGGSLASIIGEFGNSAEFIGRYGGLSYSALVTKIYQQTLGRDPDPAGLAYYVGELQAGNRTLQSITLDVLNGATTPPDSTVVANKLDVANHFTGKVALGCPYGGELTGVNALAPVNADPATVWAAKLATESRCGP